MNAIRARAMARDVLEQEGTSTGEELEDELAKLSDHLQRLLPEMSDEWAVVQGEDFVGRRTGPSILAVDGGLVWQVGVERAGGDDKGWRQFSVAVFQPGEFGLLIEWEALTATNPDRHQRLWRALSRVKLDPLSLAPN